VSGAGRGERPGSYRSTLWNLTDLSKAIDECADDIEHVIDKGLSAEQCQTTAHALRILAAQVAILANPARPLQVRGSHEEQAQAEAWWSNQW